MASFDPKNPFTRLPGESAKANKALIAYWQMGSDRTLTKLHEQLSAGTDLAKKPTYNTVKQWCHDHYWLERVKLAEQQDADQSVNRHRDSYISSIQSLREQTHSISQDLFAETKAQLEQLTAHRQSIENARSSDLAAMAKTLHTIAQTAEVTTAMACRALGIDKIMETVFEKK